MAEAIALDANVISVLFASWEAVSSLILELTFGQSSDDTALDGGQSSAFTDVKSAHESEDLSETLN